MAERFTGPSRECMEWLGEMGPSADDLHGSLTGCTARALESELFQELACTAACESASRRYINGQTDGRFIGHVNFQRFGVEPWVPKEPAKALTIPQYGRPGKGLTPFPRYHVKLWFDRISAPFSRTQGSIYNL